MRAGCHGPSLSVRGLARLPVGRKGFLPVWYMAVAVAMGVGKNAWTWSGRNPLRLQPRRPSSCPRSQIGVAGVSTTCKVTAAAALRCLGW